MYKAWFDGAFHERRKLSVLGVYIENEKKEKVYAHSLFRKDLVSSSEAEIYALLSLLEVIQKQYKNERFMIYGDDQSLIEKIKGEKIEEPLILSCLEELKGCNLTHSSIEWLERDYNKADIYTQVGENKRSKHVVTLGNMKAEEMNDFILSDVAYNTYVSKTHGNDKLSKKTAQKKINRNIQRAKGKSFVLKDGTVVYIYFSMLIFTKYGHITRLVLEKGHAKGANFYKKNLEKLEEINQDTHDVIYA